MSQAAPAAAGAPRPVSPERLADVLARLVVEVAGSLPHASDRVLRVVVDGAPVAGPARLADALVDPLRVRGRPVLRLTAEAFLRPASLRLERGRTDPAAYYEEWLDAAGLRREVLEPLGPGGSRRYLPTLWDAAADRATRADYATAPPGAVLLLDGALLLGRRLPVDLSIHLWLSPAALRRRTPQPEQWTLPAYERYEAEVAPADTADVVIRVDDPRHPALSVRE